MSKDQLSIGRTVLLLAVVRYSVSRKSSDNQTEVAHPQSGKTITPVFPFLIGFASVAIVASVFGYRLFEFLWTLPGALILSGMTGISGGFLYWVDQQTGERFQWELWSIDD